MLSDPPPLKIPRRRPPKANPPPKAPTAVNQITLVKPGDAPEQLLVFLSEPITSVGDFHTMLTASVSGELWLLPVAINSDDPTVLVFTMNGDASATTMWRVPAPGRGNYHFAGGGSLVEPFTGEIG